MGYSWAEQSFAGPIWGASVRRDGAVAAAVVALDREPPFFWFKERQNKRYGKRRERRGLLFLRAVGFLLPGPCFAIVLTNNSLKSGG